MPDGRIEHDHRRRLSARKDEITERHFHGTRQRNDPLVDPLVAAADDRETLTAGQFPGHLFREQLPPR